MRRFGVLCVAVGLLAGCSGGSSGDPGDPGDPPPVVGPADCDVVAQTGCDEGQKCAWIRTAASAGVMGCVPEGSKADGASCAFGAFGETTGYDDCAGGLVCLAGVDANATGTCRTTCDRNDPDACGATGACQQYVGTFDDESALGVCDPACDPNTQVRLTDSAEACGSPDPSAPTLGCYGAPSGSEVPTKFFCAPAGSAEKTHRVPAASDTGQVYLNSCAPGYLALLRESTGSSTVVCVALCSPVESHQGNTDGLHGAAPYGCPDRGATATSEECRFLGWIEGDETPVSTMSNAVGFCFDHTKYTWDHDRDPATAEVPQPSCADLPNTDDDADGVADHAAWGCAPRPAP